MFATLLEHLPPVLLESSLRHNLKQDELLYRHGERAACVYLLEYGRLRMFSVDSEGRSVPLYVVRPGECVSEAALFSEIVCGNVAAEVRSRVRCFQKGPLLEMLGNNPELSLRYMMEMAQRFNDLRVRLELRNLRSARQRVLQYLITSAPVGKCDIIVDRPLKSIADDLGLTPESFYRTLAQLASERVVTRTKKLIILHLRENTASANEVVLGKAWSRAD